MSEETFQNKIDKSDKPLPFWGIALIPVYISIMFIILLFPLAQDWGWFEAWLFIISLVVNFTISYYLINKKNPRVLRNRMKVKKVVLQRKQKDPQDQINL